MPYSCAVGAKVGLCLTSACSFSFEGEKDTGEEPETVEVNLGTVVKCSFSWSNEISTKGAAINKSYHQYWIDWIYKAQQGAWKNTLPL